MRPELHAVKDSKSEAQSGRDTTRPQSLIKIYQALKNKYRNYDTKHALKRMQAFRRSAQELGSKGFPLAFELLGSINFGLVEPYSDADVIILHYCDLHLSDGECMPSCPNLLFEKEELVKSLRRQLNEEMCRIEILDCINMKYVERCLQTGELSGNSIIYRFMFYRNMGRPVNRPLYIEYYEALEKNASLVAEFELWASLALKAYLKTSDHRYSFSKYNERILNQRIALPEGLREELRRYLEDA